MQAGPFCNILVNHYLRLSARPSLIYTSSSVSKSQVRVVSLCLAMKVSYTSSPVVSDSNSSFSDPESFIVTDLNEVTRQYSLYKQKLEEQRRLDLREVLQLSYDYNDSSIVENVPMESLLPKSSVNVLQLYANKGTKN